MDYKELLAWIDERFEREFGKNSSPKYETLCQVIQQAIREKKVRPGDRLPPEQYMSENLPVSQVTVRKCFTKLALRGVISREHGRGTFISDAEQSVSDLWHFRFRDPLAEGLMPIYNRILSLEVYSKSNISSIMGGGEKLIRVERAVNIGARFNCYSELFLPHKRFAGIMELPLVELERVNLKDILADLFHAPTIRVNQNLRIDSLPERAAETVGRPAGAKVLLLRVEGYSFDDEPISHQDIWIPETEFELNLPASGTDESVQRTKPEHLKVVGRSSGSQ